MSKSVPKIHTKRPPVAVCEHILDRTAVEYDLDMFGLYACPECFGDPHVYCEVSPSTWYRRRKELEYVDMTTPDSD